MGHQVRDSMSAVQGRQASRQPTAASPLARANAAGMLMLRPPFTLVWHSNLPLSHCMFGAFCAGIIFPSIWQLLPNLSSFRAAADLYSSHGWLECRLKYGCLLCMQGPTAILQTADGLCWHAGASNSDKRQKMSEGVAPAMASAKDCCCSPMCQSSQVSTWLPSLPLPSLPRHDTSCSPVTCILLNIVLSTCATRIKLAFCVQLILTPLPVLHDKLSDALLAQCRLQKASLSAGHLCSPPSGYSAKNSPCNTH